MAQTFQDWEMIVVDDGSSQDLSFVDSMDARVRLIRQKNTGQAIARNNAIAQTSGEFVAFLDADDVWLPHKLERQLEIMNARPEVALCHTQFEMIDADGKRTGDGFTGAMNLYLELLGGCGIGISSTMVRRAVLSSVGVFEQFASPSDDYDLWLRIARHHAMARLGETSMQYRTHGENMSGNYRVMFSVSHNILERHRVAARKSGDKKLEAAAACGQKKIARVYASQAFDRVRENVHRRQPTQALPHLGFALRYSPVFVAQSLWAFLRRR